MKKIDFPLSDRSILKDFRCGDEILLNGYIYTARDRVHKFLDSSGHWPFELENNAIFYSGPTPGRPGFPFGSCGPTTSGRMDEFTPDLYSKGLVATIGKGPRNEKVIMSIKDNKALYIVAYGGCGALYGKTVKSVKLIDFESFGPQAVYKIEVRDFPALIGIDIFGEDIYKVKRI